MKVVILAGGVGTRISEESHLRPKPMIEIGNMPILWHIMKIYSAYGLNDFIICLGYKGYMVKEFFANYVLHRSDVTVDMSTNTISYHPNDAETWTVTLVDTGLDTMTGGRIKRIAKYLDPNKRFCMTYGDGVSDVDISSLINFHEKEGRRATVTVVRPVGRYGTAKLEDNKVDTFQEKPEGEGDYINGGFFVLEPSVINRIDDDAIIWEREPLEGLARDGELSAFKHEGFWQPMDTMRERHLLEELWRTGSAPWKIWD